jgi:cytochrome c553
MNHTSTAALLALALVAPVAFANEAASDPAAFEQKLQACGACHGANGDKPLAPDYPIIAGQPADYLSAALRHYRDGRRNNPIMGAQIQALQLSEQDIVALGNHFSRQKSPLAALKP